MRGKFIVLILIQVLLLTGMIIYRQYWVHTGQRIILVTEPVDPRDIFRGDYVRLSYEISRLDLNKLGVKERFKRGEKIYVHLEKDDRGTFSASSATKVQPAGKTFIQGRVSNVSANAQRYTIHLLDDFGNIHVLEARWFHGKKGERLTFALDARNRVLNYSKEEKSPGSGNATNRWITGTVGEIKVEKVTQLNVEYGIESYFVEEGKGRQIEASRESRNLRVEVSLRKDGQGMITALVMGKTVFR